MISTASSDMISSDSGRFCDCFIKTGAESNGTAMSSNGTGTSPPFSISPTVTSQFPYGLRHQQHLSCMRGPMSITAQGALERNSANNMTECVAVPTSEHVAEIVGKQGCKIKSLRDKTNTYIKTPMRGEEPIFVITGRLEDVEIAKCEIVQAAEHFTQIRAQRRLQPPAVPGQVSQKMQVPLRLVGLIVGPKGQTIKRIQQDTNTYIVTPGREKEPIFDITGPRDGVNTAREMIAEHILSRTGNTVEELLRQQAEQGTTAMRPRSCSVDETAVANFDIGCWNVEPEPESDGDGSDSGMIMGTNGLTYPMTNVYHAYSQAQRFALFSAASSGFHDTKSVLMPQQQHGRTNGVPSYRRFNNIANGSDTVVTIGSNCSSGTSMYSNSNCNSSSSNPSNRFESDATGLLTRPHVAAADIDHLAPVQYNSKIRSASFSMIGGYYCGLGESSPEQPKNNQQQSHRAATAAVTAASNRRSLQYNSMAEAFGDTYHNATFLASAGLDADTNTNGFQYLQQQNHFRRLNCEPHHCSALRAVGEYSSDEQRVQVRRSSQPFGINHYCQSAQRNGYEQHAMATTPTNLISSNSAASASSTSFWSDSPASSTAPSSAVLKTENSSGLFVVPDRDKMMSALALGPDADSGAGFVNLTNNGRSSKAASASTSSSSASSSDHNIWVNNNSTAGNGMTNGNSKIFMF